MAALQLLVQGVEDVENFDFIQAPDGEASRQAMTTLRLLGAVDEQAKLTPLGCKMATLPLEPRLSKLVLEGVKRGLALEAVSLAALISAPGSIFYRGGANKDKEKADRLKLKFCHESGDIITMLNAYIQWRNQPENLRTAWCMENSMNSKTLRAIEETVKDVLRVLKRKHKISCNTKDKMEALDKAKREALQKIILSGYFRTLSLYNGHQRAGYTVLPQQKSAHVHPSSALKALGSNPKWVVYEKFMHTSRDFLFNLTQVDVSWLDEVAPVFSREIDLKALQETAMEKLPSVPLGTALMRQLIMKRNEKIRALEEKITAEQDSPCILEVDRSAKELHVFVNRQCSSFAVSYVQRFLDNERRMMERQQIEVPVGESGVVRQVVIAGAVTRFILMAKDYRSLEISNMPDDATEDDVERIMHSACCSKEEILEVYKFPRQSMMAKANKWGRVTFTSPEVAASIKERIDAAGETSISVKPIQGRGFLKPDIRQVNSRVVITWFTWPSKGYAFVNCESFENATMLKQVIQGLPVGGCPLQCKFTRKDKKALFISNLNEHATQEELEKAIKRRTDIPFTKCTIVRDQPQQPIPTPEEVIGDIHKMFDGAVSPDEMKIDILPVKSERIQMHKAIVTFSGDNEGRVDARVADIENNPRYNSMEQMYHAKITASCMLFCSPEVYDCLEEEIERLVDTAKNEKEDLVIRVSRSHKMRDWVISISGGKIQDVHVVRRSLLAYVQGETVPLSDLYQEQMTHQKRSRVLEILQNGIRDLLRGLDAHATVDARRQVTVIFGRDTVREELKGRLRDSVQLICDTMLKEIPLTVGLSPHCTKGQVIRALVRTYGPRLKKLQDKSRARRITLNTREGVLLIEGDQSVFDKVHKMVHDWLKKTSLHQGAIASVEEEEAGEEVECGICYTPVEGNQEIFRLTACSHGFHQECLLEMFKVRLRDASKDYPIECPYEDCGCAMLLCDIRILCPDEDKRLRLYQLALEAHVTQKSNGELKFCPTADCNMIYKTTKDAQTFVCPECGGQLCSSCAEEAHPGQTCKEFMISGKNFDDIKEWIQESGKDVKECPVPGCGATIEKEDGCDHMTCLVCQQHICWVCLEYFSNSDACYSHLDSKHKSYDDGWEDDGRG